jgi:aspartate aminotransferase
VTSTIPADRELASRMQRLPQSASVAAAAKARELRELGRDILDLTIGEPDFDTPAHVKSAAIDAILRGETKYTPVNGTPLLRTAIIDRLQRSTGVRYTDQEITVGGGAKQIIFLALLATVESGDEVIVPAPYWVSYPDIVAFHGATPVVLPCSQTNGFKLTAEDLAATITPATRWLILNAPSNPTGAAYASAELRAIADVLLANPRVCVLTDEIYDEIWFDGGKSTSLVEVEPALRNRILLVNGVSKSYAMTGWRLGYAAGPTALIKAINTLQSQSSSCPSSISQAAAAAALNGGNTFIAETVHEYRRRRDLALRLLRAIPELNVETPQGAFYLYINCAGAIGRRTPAGTVIGDDQDFVLYLLESVGVATIHGGAYGYSPYFRISFATSDEVLTEACRRIAAACAALS